MGRLAFAGVSVALAACGAGHAGVVIGSVGGQIFRVVDGTAAIRMSSGETFARIQLGDRPSLCDLESRYTVTQSAHTLIIDLADFSANRDNYQAPSAPGTYTPTSPAGGPFYDHTAFVEARTTDANCAYVPGQSARATSGAVTLTRVTNGTFAGTFDVMLESGDRLTGSFEVLDCPAIGGTSDGGTVGSCG